MLCYARIKVNDETIPGTNERLVTIWGTEAQAQMVMAMIQEVLVRPDTTRAQRQPPPPQAQQQARHLTQTVASMHRAC